MTNLGESCTKLEMLRLFLLVAPAAAFVHLASVRPRPQFAYTIDQTELEGPLVPLTNFILVEIDAAKDVSTGGIVLSSKEKSQSGKVVAVGPGREHKETGATLPIQIKEGERVLWGRYDGAEVKYCGKPHTLLRDTDVALVWDGDTQSPTEDTARVVHGNVLLKVLRKPGETASGLVLSAVDEDVPVEGQVVFKGDGALTRDGTPLPIPVEVGDCVKFRDYDTTDVTIQAEDYVVINSNDMICKWKP